MSSEKSTESAAIACPLCGAPAERGCVMSGSGHWLQWFNGPPTFWKKITAGVFISSPGESVGGMGQLCGSYLEGVRSHGCDFIICGPANPNRGKG
jgi:hypothetical protein